MEDHTDIDALIDSAYADISDVPERDESTFDDSGTILLGLEVPKILCSHPSVQDENARFAVAGSGLSIEGEEALYEQGLTHMEIVSKLLDIWINTVVTRMLEHTGGLQIVHVPPDYYTFGD